MSPTSTLLGIFVEPARAMQAVREKSMIWLPLLLLLLGVSAVQVWYYQAVDIAWLQEYFLSAGGANNPDPQALEAAKGFMSRGFLTGMTLIGIFIMMPLMMLILSVYYLLAAKVIGSDIGFGKWFAFVVWSAVPTLLLIPAGIIQILMSSNGQMAPDALNPLSLNQLVFHHPVTSPWAGLAGAIHLPSIWASIVAIIGYKVWTAKSTLTSTIVVLLPQVVIFGGWALIAYLRSAA